MKDRSQRRYRMAKRFSATEIWDEDWFLDMPIEYKLFWFYMLSMCDHAGLFKVNTKKFCLTNSVKVDAVQAIEFFNSGKLRIRVVKENFWFIEDFIFFQYGKHLNRRNKTHESILKILSKFNISILSVRGVEEVTEGSKTGLNGVS